MLTVFFDTDTDFKMTLLAFGQKCINLSVYS